MIIVLDLPEGEISIKKGQLLDFDTPLVEKKVMTERRVSLAAALSVSPDKIFNHLKKFVGETVKKGDIIAEKKGLISSKKYKSDFEGILKEVDHTDGTITFLIPGDKSNTVFSYVKGEITEITPDRQVYIKVKKGHEYPVKETTADFGSHLLLMKEEPSLTTLTEDDVKGKVIITPRLSQFAQAKFEALGALGFVTREAPSQIPPFYARLSQEDSWSKLSPDEFPHCIVRRKNNTMYLYL